MISPPSFQPCHRNQTCACKPNKYYSVSQKSMFLSLLWLIGLRCNQIEQDNCAPVTFPPRQVESGERKGLREGRGICVCTVLCVQLGKGELPEVPPFCCSMLHRATEPQRKAPQRDQSWRGDVCVVSSEDKCICNFSDITCLMSSVFLVRLFKSLVLLFLLTSDHKSDEDGESEV